MIYFKIIINVILYVLKCHTFLNNSLLYIYMYIMIKKFVISTYKTVNIKNFPMK